MGAMQQTGNGKVLVIDDSLTVLRSVREVLEAAGYVVHTINSPFGSTPEIRKFEPDVVLLDVAMPALSGDRVVEILRNNGILEQHSNTKILLFSSRSEDDLRLITKRCGAHGYVTKGADLDDLVEKLQVWMVRN